MGACPLEFINPYLIRRFFMRFTRVYFHNIITDNINDLNVKHKIIQKQNEMKIVINVLKGISILAHAINATII